MASHSTTESITYVSSYVKYHVMYDDKTIKTIVTNQGSVAEEWVDELTLVHANNPKVVIGMNCKWNSCMLYLSPDSNNKCATLQLCIDTKCLILQLLHMDEIPQSFKSFLMNRKFTFIGVDQDISKLVSDQGLDCAKSEDIRTAVINKWPRKFRQHDFTYLAKQIAGLDMKYPGRKRLLRWEKKVLDDKEVEYACSSAYASYKIGHKLFIENLD